MSSASEKLPPPPSDDAPSCWICLDDGPDQAGRPLLRDCSCRGNSGFGHLSCVVEYSLNKSMGQPMYSGESWLYCPNCKQRYQNELAVDLTTAFVTHAETHCLETRICLDSLALKLKAYDVVSNLQSNHQEEARQTATKILSTVGQLKTEGLHEGKNIVSKEITLAISLYRRAAYDALGKMASRGGTKEGAEKAVEYFTKVRDICRATDTGLQGAEMNLAQAQLLVERTSDLTAEERLERCQKMYEEMSKEQGEGERGVIGVGVPLARELKNCYRLREAETLLAKLASISNRVHGRDHWLSEQVEAHLRFFQLRPVNVMYQGELESFNVVGYEGDDWKQCIVRGPITEHTDLRENSSTVLVGENIFTVAATQMCLRVGTPVECHGLKRAQQLNGKTGITRSRNKGTGRYEVMFEDRDLKPCLVKQENLHIILDLLDSVH